MHAKLRSALIASIATGLVGSALSASAATVASLPEQHYGQIAYATGGIGKTEARRFWKQMSKYSLAVEVLQDSGRLEGFTAGANVKIADAQGRTVFDAKAGGPFVFVDLPAGKYSVVAKLNHKVLKKHVVSVARGHTARATFEFPPHTD